MSSDDPAATRAAVAALVGAWGNHVVLSLPRPCPQGVARWLAGEVIAGWRPPDEDTGDATRPAVTA